MRRRGRRALSAAAGLLVYLVMVGSVDVWAIAQGALAGVAAAAIARVGSTPERGSAPLRRILASLPDLVIRQVVQGSWRVARVVLGLAPVPRSQRVTVTLRGAPRGTTLSLALLETWSPGTYLVWVDERRHQLVFHVFDAAERESFRRRQRALHGDDVVRVEDES